MSRRKRERERREQQALDRIRGRIVSGMHAGHLHPGARLQSYREIAAQTGVDLRAVARVYAVLAREGLVELRGKTGVFAAHQERIGGAVLAETARWMVNVLGEAWQRRIALPDYPEFLRRCVATTGVRCACVESTADQLFTLCTELARDFGLLTTPVHATSVTSATSGSLPAALRDAHLLATTSFHAAALRPLADSLGKPLVIIRLDADFTTRIEQQLLHGELTLICVDAGFAERFRAVFAVDRPESVRVILAADSHALARVRLDEPAIVTHAARQQLGSRRLPPSIQANGSTIIARESAVELIEQIVRINLEWSADAQRTKVAAANHAGCNQPEGHDTPRIASNHKIDDVEKHRAGEQAEWQDDQHLVDWMT